MHAYAHSWSPNDGDRMINYWGRFVYNMVIYWIAILFITGMHLENIQEGYEVSMRSMLNLGGLEHAPQENTYC